MKKYISIIAFYFVFMINVVASSDINIVECNMSQEYKNWLELPDNVRYKYTEPFYCEGDELIDEMGTTNLPSSYSSVDLGYITSVKNQSSTGSCWAHASNAQVEANIKMKNGVTLDLSETHIDYMTSGTTYYDKETSSYKSSFSDNGENQYGYSRKVDTGGNTKYSASYYFNRNGAIKDSLMPLYRYSGTTGFKTISAEELNSIDSTPVVNVTNYGIVEVSGGTCSNTDIETIKEWIMEYGAVQIGIYYNKAAFMNTDGNYYMYDGTSYDGNGNLIKSTNHAVTVVGWDDSIDKSNFLSNKVSQNGAWIIKNSHGTTSGNKGYFYLSYDDILACSHYSYFEAENGNNEDYAYMSNPLMYNATVTIPFASSINNFYTFTEFNRQTTDEEYLERVSVAVAAGQTVTVYLIEDEANLETFTKWNTIGQITADYNGVYTITPTKEYQLNHSNYYIAVRYTKGSKVLTVSKSSNISSSWSNVTYDNKGNNRISKRSFAGAKGNSGWQYVDINAQGHGTSLYAYTHGKMYEKGEVTSSAERVYVESYDKFTFSYNRSNALDESSMTIKVFKEHTEVTELFTISKKESLIELKRKSDITSGSYVLKMYDKSNNLLGEYDFTYYDILLSKNENFEVTKPKIIVRDDNLLKLTINDIKNSLRVDELATYRFLDNKGNEVTGENIGTNYKMIVNTYSYNFLVYGDVEADGVINSQDYVKIKNQIMSDEEDYITNPNEKLAADYNRDGVINSLDYVKIKNLIMNAD